MLLAEKHKLSDREAPDLSLCLLNIDECADVVIQDLERLSNAFEGFRYLRHSEDHEVTGHQARIGANPILNRSRRSACVS